MGYTIPVLPALDRVQRERFLKVWMLAMEEDSDSGSSDSDMAGLMSDSDSGSSDDEMDAFQFVFVAGLEDADLPFDPVDCTNIPATISDFSSTECWLNFLTFVSKREIYTV
ncbi:hypothetical protein CYMTET_48948 [Cymbomonas tetramitiformis]|uniref:Uncharacterized protein n=1 Tax=Cymbomonas tetramitiformis TaxID=36881 RepID=A0AAE0EV13_9CHLO|nr:hypothetical protein CYMTET_48948 [Cymbomonas tetramitiformis]